ncbi:hypothetical protein BRC72_11700 [Halobacteriales archaeon QH_7_66_36]|nr:MAG: hypothetical protein BRC72_11700 [Halobacteriales archaeon QH_7_66_36]
MVEVPDKAWLALVDRLQSIEAGDEIWWSHLEDNEKGIGDNQASLVLERAADLGMIKQVDEDTWEKREPVVDRSEREE